MERYIEYIFKRRNELRNKERIEHKKGKQKKENKKYNNCEGNIKYYKSSVKYKSIKE